MTNFLTREKPQNRRSPNTKQERQVGGNGIILFLFIKRLHSNLNIMSLVAVKKRKSGKIGKIEIKWIEK